MGCRAFALRGLPAWLLVAPRVFRAPEVPAAREIATREPAARSGRSRSPPVPSGPSGALHNSGAWWLIDGWARRPKPGQALPLSTSPRPGPPGSPAPFTPAAYAVLRLPSNVARNSLAVIS